MSFGTLVSYPQTLASSLVLTTQINSTLTFEELLIFVPLVGPTSSTPCLFALLSIAIAGQGPNRLLIQNTDILPTA